MSQEAEVILDEIDVIKLDITLWTSSKKLRKEDLVLAQGSKLPPEDLAYLGTKKTIDPKSLKELNRIKKEAERICLRNGTRFLGGFANPKERIPEVTQDLNRLSADFEVEKARFIGEYAKETQDWIDSHPEFGDAIRRAVEPVESVAHKLRFDYVVFHVSKPAMERPQSTSGQPEGTLQRAVGSLGDQIFHEIALEANELVNRSFVGKATVTGRIFGAFRRFRDKLDGLGFIDYRCMPMVDEIDAVLATMPKAGPYSGAAFNDLFRLAMLLSDADKIKNHGKGLIDNGPGKPESWGFDDEDDDGEDAEGTALAPPVESDSSAQTLAPSYFDADDIGHDQPQVKQNAYDLFPDGFEDDEIKPENAGDDQVLIFPVPPVPAQATGEDFWF